MDPPQLQNVKRLRFALDLRGTPVPSLGYRCITARRRAARSPITPSWYGTWRFPEVAAVEGVRPPIQTDIYALDIRPDGTLELTERATGECARDLHYFSDSADAGDVYGFGALPGAGSILSLGASCVVSTVTAGPLHWSFSCEWRLQVPKELDDGRLRRSRETDELRVCTSVSLVEGSPWLTFETRVDNTVRDHKLTVWFPAGESVENVAVAQPFHLSPRSIGEHTTRGWLESAAGLGPQLHFSVLRGRTRTMIVANEGLPGYEMSRRGDEAVFGLTLVRGVGWMSRLDNTSRPTRAGITISTPGAQAQGVLHSRYGFALLRGCLSDEAIYAIVHKWFTPLLAQEIRAPELATTGVLPSSFGMLTVAPATVVVSAIKPASAGDSTMLRVWNPSDGAVNASVSLSVPVSEVLRCDLLEQPTAQVEHGAEGFRVELGPHEIATVLVRTEF